MTQKTPPTAQAAPPEPLDLAAHAFFLDFDGTLAPIVARPSEVRMADGTRALLDRLMRATGGAVAVISGRGMADLRSHLQGLPLALSGSHGHETSLPGGPAQPGAQPQPALEAVFADLRIVADTDALLVERKAGAVALHYRNRPDLADACRAAVASAADVHGLRCLHGNMVSEAVVAGVDKGVALRRFLAHAPFAGRVPVMIGDDTTDEDGFVAAQQNGGFGLRIGAVETAARYRVATMDDALAWLGRALRNPG